MTRVPLISGNWKMNMNHFEAIQLLQKLGYALAKHDFETVNVTVHPPFHRYSLGPNCYRRRPHEVFVRCSELPF